MQLTTNVPYQGTQKFQAMFSTGGDGMFNFNAGGSIISTGSSYEVKDDLIGKHIGNDFRGSDFSGKSLKEATFEGENNFQGVPFTGADLAGVDFKQANLKETTFRGANLTGVDFSKATFDADLGDAFRDVTINGGKFPRAFERDFYFHQSLKDCRRNLGFERPQFV